jgi:hypothetical protein
MKVSSDLGRGVIGVISGRSAAFLGARMDCFNCRSSGACSRWSMPEDRLKDRLFSRPRFDPV